MPNLMTCPSEYDLQQLLLGQVPDAEAESLEEHLEHCDRCLQTASTLKLEDTLSEAVRAQATAPELSTGELVKGLMERLETLRPAVTASPNTVAITVPGKDTPSENAEAQPAPAVEATQVIFTFLAPPETPEELGRLGQIRIRRVLGAGGMGVVFEALDPRLGRLVALKAMLPALASNPSAHQRFLREAQAVAAIEHDHIIAIHQVGEEGGVPYLAMPLLKGETLEDRLKRDTRLAAPLLLQIGRETAQGLAAAHARGLIHRDIKPANLWLELKEGETVTDTLTPVAEKPIKRVKILDFGLARAAGDTTQLTQLGAIVGTPAFMAPEQTRAGGVVDHRADLFSLGCVLYRAATGELPFKGGDTMSILSALALDTPPSPRELNPQIPAALSELIMQLLAKKPEDRPASAQQVVARISAAEQEPAGGKTSPIRRRGRPGWIAVAAAVVAALALAAYQFGPTVYRFVTKQGEIIITTEAPVQVTVKQGGKQIRILDTETKQELVLDAGDYEVEVGKGARPMYAFPQRFTLHRGGRQIVDVTFNPAPVGLGGSPNAAPVTRAMTRAVPMTTVTRAGPGAAPASPFLIWSIHALGRPTGKPLTQDGVTKEEDAWRIEAEEPRTVRLFEIPEPSVEDCTVIFRAAMKSEKLKGRAYLEMFCHFPGQGDFFSRDLEHPIQGTTGWSTYETPFYLKKGERPDMIKLNLVIKGKGTVWIKDLKLLRAPLPAMGQPNQPAAEPTGNRTPKGKGIGIAEFLAKAVPVKGESYGVIPAQLGVTTLGDAWRIDADGKRTAEIYEINKPKFPGEGPLLIMYRAEMKLKDFTGVTYLEVVGQDFSSSDGMVTPSRLANKVTTDWVPCTTPVNLKKGQLPGWIKLRVVVEGKGTVWVKNPQLLAMPIPNADKTDLQGSPREPGDQRLRGARAPFPDGEIRRFADHLGPVAAVRFSPDGKVVFAGGADGVRAWNAATGRRIWHVPDLSVFDMEVSRDGQQLLAGVLVQNKSGSVCLLDAATGKILRTTKVSDNWGCNLAFVGDGSRYVALQSEHAFLLRETKTNKDIARYISPDMTITCIAVSPDGKWAVTGGYGMGLWNLNRPEEKSGFEQEHKGPIPDVAFSPDGKRVLSGGTDGTVRLWEVSRGRQIRELKGPNGQNACVTSVAFSPDGRYAVAGREDGTIELWHVSTGIHLGQYRPSQRDVRSVTFSPDGLSGLAGGADGSVWQWQLPPGSLIISD